MNQRIFALLCYTFISLATIGGILLGNTFPGDQRDFRTVVGALIGLAASTVIVWFVSGTIRGRDNPYL